MVKMMVWVNVFFVLNLAAFTAADESVMHDTVLKQMFALHDKTWTIEV